MLSRKKSIIKAKISWNKVSYFVNVGTLEFVAVLFQKLAQVSRKYFHSYLLIYFDIKFLGQSKQKLTNFNML